MQCSNDLDCTATVSGHSKLFLLSFCVIKSHCSLQMNSGYSIHPSSSALGGQRKTQDHLPGMVYGPTSVDLG